MLPTLRFSTLSIHMRLTFKCTRTKCSNYQQFIRIFPKSNDRYHTIVSTNGVSVFPFLLFYFLICRNLFQKLFLTFNLVSYKNMCRIKKNPMSRAKTENKLKRKISDKWSVLSTNRIEMTTMPKTNPRNEIKHKIIEMGQFFSVHLIDDLKFFFFFIII